MLELQHPVRGAADLDRQLDTLSQLLDSYPGVVSHVTVEEGISSRGMTASDLASYLLAVRDVLLQFNDDILLGACKWRGRCAWMVDMAWTSHG